MPLGFSIERHIAFNCHYSEIFYLFVSSYVLLKLCIKSKNIFSISCMLNW